VRAVKRSVFGIRFATLRSGVLSGIRHLAATGVDPALRSVRPPRTDGAYVHGRVQRASPDIHVLRFDGDAAYWFSTDDLNRSIDEIRTAQTTLDRRAYHMDDGGYVIPAIKLRVIIPNERELVFWNLNEASEYFPSVYTEMRFVSDGEISKGRGSATAPLVNSLWPAVATPDGSFVAPDIG
jgi:hypothetical protein